ncbi:MAG: DJ-1/PfpI family protein [Acidaminococcaceae bacterium]|nr:DJ-1/PfpI family protein [Acidaminococcaceae bacterium]MDD4722414.1 DJ-1/PfpI family protein [Acidaminococcaceae bacterium]
MNINIMLFDDFETLDAFGPVEILSRIPSHVLKYYSMAGGIVTSAQGMKIETESICTANQNGTLVVPGGRGTRALVNDEKFLACLKTMGEKAVFCLSICTGSALLARAGLLNDKKATSNKKAFVWVMSTSDKVKWLKNARWVVDEKFYTSSGVSAGMDMTLGFVSDQYGVDNARQIAQDIEYIWHADKEQDSFAVKEG